MCDTLYAAPEATADHLALLAKNSDRPPNEAQYLAWFPARSYSEDEKLGCTYIQIPQAKHTYAVLLSKPYWMWGAEMGVNEHGLAIGNETLFSKIPANKEPALLGMDLLRLGLERAKTASQAVEVIVNLLERYGQGGNNSHTGHLYYHNSFLMADAEECWVLETVGRHWAARKANPFYSISNRITLTTSWDRSSPDLTQYLLDKKLARSEQEIDLERNFSDFLFTTFADGGRRCQRSRDLLSRDQGEIGIQTMVVILRDHQVHPDPTSGLSGADICMHAGPGPIRISQTTGSLIASLSKDHPLIFATGTAAPCTGIFKPVWVDAPPSRPLAIPDGRYDPETLFWAHERLHRKVLENYPARLAAYREQRDALERDFIRGAYQRRDASLVERRAYSEACFLKAAQATEDWLKLVQDIPPRMSWLHRMAWSGFNRKAHFP
jgi:secernin